ncbi:MAG: low molecular weight phosphatase family protein [Verrucomicrobia bacterium]|nr:low molecular weight phosphatase family protein [Verrucomicrobiota bacterium]MBV8533895.1 low molecular weight phosphatase family protein [Verrucomicrobiota bacterium]
MNHRILFICTGNFYRSRFAEAVFNYHAERQQIPWTAMSRGLAIHLTEGYLSSFAAEALLERQIDLRYTGRQRVQLLEDDLLKSDRSIAMDRAEHLPMMQNQFPAWVDRIGYWDVPDIPHRPFKEALREIEQNIIRLLQEVSA